MAQRKKMTEEQALERIEEAARDSHKSQTLSCKE